MSNINSMTEIKNGKVVFSKEILNYFESIRTEENSEWINKYFDVLSDVSNFDSEKYNQHHIKPCCTFKDENHKNISQTQELGDAFNGNIIKLSVYNHLFAHYYLWKIFDDIDLRTAFKRMCGEGKYIDNLTEDEIREIAKLNEECANENKTEEEYKEYRKQWYENNKEYCSKKAKERYEQDKENILKRNKEWKDNNKEKRKEKGKLYREKNKDRESKRTKQWYEDNKEKVLARCKERYENNKEKISEQRKERNQKLCEDPIKGDRCKYSTLNARKYSHPDLYVGVIASKCIIKSENL